MSDEEKLELHDIDVDGAFKFEIHENGVYLSVYPAQGKGLRITEPVILQEIKERNITGYKNEQIVQIVREATGESVKIAEIVPLCDPEVQIIVSRDRMEAFLEIALPPNSRPLQLDFVMEKIQKSGIVFGIDHEAVQQAFARPGLKVKCAAGQPVIEGQNSHIEYYVDLDKKGRPAEQEDGSVDFKNLNMFTIVRQGELLAEKFPATPGTPGTDILGQTIAAKPGRDIPLPVGKNVQIVDNNKLVATMAGQVLAVNNKINVLPVIEIKEDVDLSTGNIDFVGNVVIRGSVQTGFTVKADGNVEVFGTVSGGTVEGKNVIVKMGIQGMHRGYIKATESVITKFIENATVYAGRDVLVSEVILHSRINAGKQVIVEGKRGVITGGTVMAGEEIRAKTVGTQMATATELEVGVNPMLREEYQELRKDIKNKELNLQQTQKALVILRSMDPHTISADKREMLLKLTKAQFQLAGQTEQMRSRLGEIEQQLEEMRHGKVRVSDTVYPGVKIAVGNYIKQIRESAKFVTFYAEDGDIRVGPFK